MGLFIFYRLVEKFSTFRLESWIGLIIFSRLYRFKWYKKPSITVRDKRTTWEDLRLTDSQEPLENHFEKLFSVYHVSFENSMETSIRGINCILSIWQGLRTEATDSILNKYIKATYYHSIICPDLYIKRSRWRLKDESNNHRFYNLLLHQFYKIHFNKSFLESLETFVNQRLVNDYFYDEGSSFYHFGVIDALLKLRIYANSNKLTVNFSESFNKFLDRAKININVIRDLNFGDRDGTTIAPWMTTGAPSTPTVDNIDIEKFFLHAYESNILMFRKENWCELGTQGHVHDDFGQLIYKSPNAAILDPGIYSYSEEPYLAKKKFHNFPYDRGLPEINYVRKFERQIPRNKQVESHDSWLVLREYGENRCIVRKFNLLDKSVDDYIDCKSNYNTVITWRFFIDGDIVSGASQSQHPSIISIGGEIKLGLHPDAVFRVCEGRYFPEYGQERRCNVLLIRLQIKTLEAQKIKLLSISFPQNEKVYNV